MYLNYIYKLKVNTSCEHHTWSWTGVFVYYRHNFFFFLFVLFCSLFPESFRHMVHYGAQRAQLNETCMKEGECVWWHLTAHLKALCWRSRVFHPKHTAGLLIPRPAGGKLKPRHCSWTSKHHVALLPKSSSPAEGRYSAT